MFQLHCLNPISKIGLNNLTDNYALTEDVNAAQGILVRSAVMHDMDLPEGLLAVARAGAGVNNIPLDKCAEKGIVVFNTPGANANGVKELVIAGMLLASRDVVGGINWVNANKDDEAIAKTAEKQKKHYAGFEIQGKTLGVIGLGAIGIKVANAARHLGMKVLGYDPYISVDAAWSLSRDVKHVTDLDEIYATCDFITIHVPAMDSTKGYIGAAAIAKMKPNAVILNFARDLLCDEAAVLEALDAGKIAKYVSDFPNPKTAGHPGCIVIPHLGASTEESEDNCAVMAVDEMMDYLENGNITNSVNYPACNMGICKTAGRVAVFHKNVANMISQLTACIGEAGINIAEIVNKSRGDVAYTMMDIEQPVTAEVIAKLEAFDGVFRARIVK
ncbi:MAG: phosphoglycerate dehydrogenase [Lachnospiraceae bacterium]|nr:phosphoglycerate dehydrogenase [Lachnospiraceae bacterium]